MQEDQRSDVSPQSLGMLTRWRSAFLSRMPQEASDPDVGLESALPWLVPEHSPPGQA
jgi:hypothetical protein